MYKHTISEYVNATRFDLDQESHQATRFHIKFLNFIQRIAIANLALFAGFDTHPHVKQNIIGHWGEVVPSRENSRRQNSRPGTTSPQ